jgi:hypothetical protein
MTELPFLSSLTNLDVEHQRPNRINGISTNELDRCLFDRGWVVTKSRQLTRYYIGAMRQRELPVASLRIGQDTTISTLNSILYTHLSCNMPFEEFCSDLDLGKISSIAGVTPVHLIAEMTDCRETRGVIDTEPIREGKHAGKHKATLYYLHNLGTDPYLTLHTMQRYVTSNILNVLMYTKNEGYLPSTLLQFKGRQ